MKQIHSIVVIFCLTILVLPQQLYAAEEEGCKNCTVGKWAFQKLSKAHEAISAGKYKEAKGLMDSLSKKLRLNDHERALMWQTYGYIYSSQEQFPQAINAFAKCLSFNALPKGAAVNTQYNLGQLYLANKQFKKAIETLEDWLTKVKNPAPIAMHMLAMAHAQQKSFSQALQYAKRSIADTKKPQESWMQLLLSIYYEMKDYRGVIETLKPLIRLYAKKSYWLQLSASYLELKDEKNALAALELANIQGLLYKRGELMNLASLYLQLAVPFKAAQVLQSGMDAGIIEQEVNSLTMLADSWLRARELQLAIPPLQKAATLAKDGDRFVRLAQIFMELQDWKQAVSMLQAALSKATVTNPGNVHLFIGIAHFQAKQYLQAKRAFLIASQFDRTKKQANQWIKIISKQ